MTTTTLLNLFFIAWSESTGQESDQRFIKQNERLVWEFLNAGFTCEELRRVISYMKHENSKGGRFKLQLHKVAGDLERFASILADCKARDRNRRPTPTARETALESFHPIIDPENKPTTSTGHHISDFIRRP